MKPPIKNYIQKYYPKGQITQWFGEHIELYKQILGLTKGHNGIDIVAPWGTPILATTTQTIVEVKDTPNGYGKHIKAIDDEYEYTYGHLSSISVELGNIVSQGTEIGKMGNTGFVISGATPFWKYNPYAGTHLHLGGRKFRKRVGNESYNIQYSNGIQGTILNYDNGSLGSIDLALLIEWDNTNNIRQKQLTIISLANQVIALLKGILRVGK